VEITTQEYGHKIMLNKGINISFVNSISRLDFGPVKDDKANWMTFTKCWCQYTIHNAESTYDHQEQVNMVFANHRELPINSKGNCTSPGGQFSPDETKQKQTSIPLNW